MRHPIYLCFVLLILGLTGCLGKPTFTPTHYFSINPEPVEPLVERPIFADAVQINDVATLADIRTKMITRVGRYQVVTSEFNRWASAPDRMITEYLYMAAREAGLWPRVYSPIEEYARYQLTGNLLVFEREDNTAVCRLQLNLIDRQTNDELTNTIHTSRVATQDESGAALAEAMSQAVRQVVTEALEAMRQAAGEIVEP